ncbi:MAG TPA: FN3 associated domain-containing protein [Chryseolinea sp.]|nr:FN3 associated domain-containing protein [Chryseolinea sp.]
MIFLLLVEDKVQLPVFLQVTGRMHPLVLHFPLVLLFVGILLEVLTRQKSFQHPAAEKITSYIFYLFAISAALTALFGFFLYKEGSYLGDEINQHKWTGTVVSILAILIVWLKEKPWVKYYYTVLGVSSVILIVAGHLGSEVTHGKGFLTEPIRNHRQLRLVSIEHADSAIVFRDVIQPILNEKCLNCHNANRAKNDLILTDYEGILNGGETGDAVVAGNAQKSLLYKYVVLPMSDSLHMPPKEKLQLDREEIKLIGWWINNGAKDNEKYVSLPKVDSIETIMQSRFQPKKGIDLLDIPFVDQEEIKALNNPYRTVQQISATKPYVAVFLGSKKDFSDKDLEELKDVRNQVVSIDIGNSNVKDDDLKNLKQFPHVQKLHLQNIAIGDEGIKYLKDLRYLDVLNISGTKVSGKTLEEVSGWKNLKKLYVYNTTVSEDTVESVRKSRPELAVYSIQFDLTDSLYSAQLTSPKVKIDSTFFREYASVEVKPSRGKVKYYYTVDGSEPTSGSTLYTEPFQIKKTTEFKIKATMEGWIDSKVVVFPLLKVGIKPDRLILETKPDPKHAGKMDTTLVDGKSADLNKDEKAYLGFVNRDHQALFQFDNARKLSQVSLSFLEDVQRGALAPEYVEVWGGNDKDNMSKLGKFSTPSSKDKRPTAKGLITINFPEQSLRYVRLKAKNSNVLPSGYEYGKDTKPGIYVDEVSLH